MPETPFFGGGILGPPIGPQGAVSQKTENASPPEQPATRKRRKKKLPKIASKAEVQRMLEYIGAHSDHDRGLRDRLAVELMYRAGLRVSEVCAVRPRDVGRDGVIRLYDAKGGDGTAYFDADTVLPQLDVWLPIREVYLSSTAASERGGLPLLIRPGGKPLTTRYLQRRVKAAKEELAITGIITPHVFRHTFATELIEEGFPIHEVQSAMRHSNLATTAVYLHVRDESLRSKISRRSEGR